MARIVQRRGAGPNGPLSSGVPATNQAPQPAGDLEECLHDSGKVVFEPLLLAIRPAHPLPLPARQVHGERQVAVG